MNHFLGFFVNDESRKKIVERVESISDIFPDMGIQVRWIKPSNYHIKLQNLNSDFGPLKKFYISKKMGDIFSKPIRVSVGDVKLGTTRKMRGLLYMEIEEGGNALRELRYDMVNKLKIKDNVQFVPHIAIGRINKDLSNQELSNILKDIENVSKASGNQSVMFDIKQIDLVSMKEGDYEILKNFKVAS